jgi:hypothetical protein
MAAQRVVVFDIDEDIEKLKKNENFKQEVELDRETFIFDPDTFPNKIEDFNLEENVLSEEQLKYYAELAFKIREKFFNRAKALVDQKIQ